MGKVKAHLSMYFTKSYAMKMYPRVQVEVLWIVTPCRVVVGIQRFRGPFSPVFRVTG